jgi:restriction system protein
MPVPGYQDLMLPLLRATSDGAVHTLKELDAVLTKQFALTKEDLDERLPSGTQKVFINRLNWAATYLKKAGLLDRPARAQLRITPEGEAVLANPPNRIDRAYLLRYPAFAEFVSAAPTSVSKVEARAGATSTSTSTDAKTPRERIGDAAKELRDALADELLLKLKAGSPDFFERVVVELLQKMGYGGSFAEAAKVLGGSGDAGLDGVIKQDRLGLEAVYVQAKRWDNTVGRPTVQGFAGSLQGQRARKGVLMTTASFSREAQDFVNNIDTKIVLIDGMQLVELMMEHNIGVATEEVVDIKRLDPGYFDEE